MVSNDKFVNVKIIFFRGPVAQLVEQLTFNQWVTGSIPVGLTKLLTLFLYKILNVNQKKLINIYQNVSF